MVYFHCSAFQGTAMAFPGRAAACTFARMFVDGDTKVGVIGAGHDKAGTFLVTLDRNARGTIKVSAVPD